MCIRYIHNILKYLRHQDIHERGGKRKPTKQKCCKFYLVLKCGAEALESHLLGSRRCTEANAPPDLKFVSGRVWCGCVRPSACVQNVSLWCWMAEVLIRG